jgi:hypothetical protein
MPLTSILANYRVIAMLVLLLAPATAAAMPAGHFLELFPDTAREDRFFISLQADSQENDFDRQRERRPDVDAGGEIRHYSEIRESEITFSQAAIKTGAAIKGLALVYLTAGYSQADIDFSFTDELTEGKNSYSKKISMDADDFAVFGGGIAARFVRKPVFKESFLEAGMDLQYRYLDFEAEKAGVKYESALHEIQLSLAAGIERVKWNLFSVIPVTFSPYGGVKISHFIGDESFRDPANTDGRDEPDPIYYSGDIDPGNHISFFAGAGFPLTQNFLLNIETCFGDDDGYAAILTARF